jgi:hypothetical protein
MNLGQLMDELEIMVKQSADYQVPVKISVPNDRPDSLTHTTHYEIDRVTFEPTKPGTGKFLILVKP